jgi:hypothetical protein
MLWELVSAVGAGAVGGSCGAAAHALGSRSNSSSSTSLSTQALASPYTPGVWACLWLRLCQAWPLVCQRVECRVLPDLVHARS